MTLEASDWLTVISGSQLGVYSWLSLGHPFRHSVLWLIMGKSKEISQDLRKKILTSTSLVSVQKFKSSKASKDKSQGTVEIVGGNWYKSISIPSKESAVWS